MHNSEQTANLIKQLAKERHIAVSTILADCNLNKDALYTMQSKGFYPRVEALSKIADYLGVSVDYLLGRTDDPLGGIADDVTEDLVIYNRNGKVIRKKMSKDAMRLLTSMLDALPEDDNPDL